MLRGWSAGPRLTTSTRARATARAGAVEGFTGRYGMAVLGISPDAAEALIAETPGWLELSVVNSPSSVVVSGDRDAIATLTARVAAEGTFVRELAVDFPAHTSRLDSAAQAMAAGLPDLRFAHPAIPFIGAATGAAVPGDTEFAGYWRHNLRTAVRFDAAVRTAVDLGARTFVELSAHPALLMALNELTEDTPQTVLTLCSGRRDTDPMDELAGQIGAAAVADPLAISRNSAIGSRAQPAHRHSSTQRRPAASSTAVRRASPVRPKLAPSLMLRSSMACSTSSHSRAW